MVVAAARVENKRSGGGGCERDFSCKRDFLFHPLVMSTMDYNPNAECH